MTGDNARREEDEDERRRDEARADGYYDGSRGWAPDPIDSLHEDAYFEGYSDGCASGEASDANEEGPS